MVDKLITAIMIAVTLAVGFMAWSVSARHGMPVKTKESKAVCGVLRTVDQGASCDKNQARIDDHSGEAEMYPLTGHTAQG